MASMTQEKTKYNIAPLNGSNYHNWKFRISMILAENACKEKFETETDVAALNDDAKKAAHEKDDNKAKSNCTVR